MQHIASHAPSLHPNKLLEDRWPLSVQLCPLPPDPGCGLPAIRPSASPLSAPRRHMPEVHLRFILAGAVTAKFSGSAVEFALDNEHTVAQAKEQIIAQLPRGMAGPGQVLSTLYLPRFQQHMFCPSG